MATYGMFNEAFNNKVRPIRGILLDRKNEEQRNGEIEAVAELNKAQGLQLKVVEKQLCFAHHEPSLAVTCSFVEVIGKTYGTNLATLITNAGQLLKHKNPNNKELFPTKQ